jgi:hypothetical protein
MIQLTERQFQDQVVALARLCGWRVMHSRPALDRRGRWSTAILGDSGYPDLTMVRSGRLLLVELKVGKNKPSPEQRAWLDLLDQVMGDAVAVYVWTPKDWSEIQRVLSLRAG